MAPLRTAVFILFLTTSASAKAAFAGSGQEKLAQADFESAKAALKSVLGPRTFFWGRDLVTFHYQDGDVVSEGPFSPSHRSEIGSRVLPMASWFQDASMASQDMLGVGLYVATDPIGSRGFGGAVDPLLFAITLRADAKGLNAVRQLARHEMGSLARAARTLGCPVRPAHQHEPGLDHVIGLWRNSDRELCRRLVISAIRELGVETILYPYTSSNGVPGCRRSRGEALIIVDPAAIKADELAFYSNAKAYGPPHLRAFINKLYQEASSDFWLSLYEPGNGPPAGPAALASAAPPPREYAAWKSARIHKCGRFWPGELNDQMTALMGRLRIEALRDREALDLIARTAAAFHRKKGQRFDAFDLASIRALASAAAKANGVSEENWLKALQIQRNTEAPESERNFATARLLGERPPSDFVRERMTQAVADLTVTVRDPASGALVLQRSAGLGPKFSVLFINALLSFVGAPPLVLPLPRALASPRENRAAVMAILRGCLDVYSSESSFDEIQSGPCAILRSQEPE